MACDKLTSPPPRGDGRRLLAAPLRAFVDFIKSSADHL